MKPRKPCRVEGCLLPKAAPSHSCAYHHLLRQPIEIQVAAAQARLASVPEEARLARVPDHLWPSDHRWCAACQSFVPTFYATGSRCRADASAAAHGASIRRDFDLSSEEYSALLNLQGGVCAICGQRPVTRRLAVDHDHTTGEVRGLLCSRCNHDLLGAGHDNVDRLRSAAAYLDMPPMSGQWRRPTISKPTRGRTVDRASIDPTYLMFDHEAVVEPLPGVLQQVVKRMTVDQLVFAGGRSDPETGTYWLAYRPAGADQPPWEVPGQPEAPAGVDAGAGASVPS